jgi:hypothetical protein
MKSDSIRFMLSAEEVVVNTTVKIVATVAVDVPPDMTEQMLRDSIRDVMQKFISSANWQLSGMTRTSTAGGMEQVSLTASTRVPEAENYKLDQRRQAASQVGLRITAASTDIAPTLQQIDETQSKLRQQLLKRALAELAMINATVQGSYRLGKVDFDPMMTPSTSNMPRGGGMMAMAAYGSGFSADAAGDGMSDIGNAVKLTMQASVQLRANTTVKIVATVAVDMPPEEGPGEAHD